MEVGSWKLAYAPRMLAVAFSVVSYCLIFVPLEFRLVLLIQLLHCHGLELRDIRYLPL